MLRLERIVHSREDYLIQLENETTMLRKEIKDCKYNNEKQGYEGFLNGLTILRQSRNNGITKSGGAVSVERKRVTISNRNTPAAVKREKSYVLNATGKENDPEHHYILNRKRSCEPPSQIFTSSIDARTRIMMSDLQRNSFYEPQNGI